MSNIEVSGSIVLYNNNEEQIRKVIESFFRTIKNVKLYLVDNSKNDTLRSLVDFSDRIEYIFNDANIGYGKAHNIAIRKSIKNNIPFHVVLNPDITFEKEVLEELYNYMQRNKNVGNIMPKVLYKNGEIQYICKLLPTPLDLIVRRFIPFNNWKEQRNEKYELRFSGYNKIMNVPSLSGCFMFLRTKVLKDVGIFDENIFMYLEDNDLNRRIHRKYKTIFYPKVHIVHDYAKESYVNKKLLFYHLKSAIYYFNKWGWFFDKERDIINRECLEELEYLRIRGQVTNTKYFK